MFLLPENDVTLTKEKEVCKNPTYVCAYIREKKMSHTVG